jgi:hypothetical protein
MTDPRDLVPAFSTEVEPTEAEAARVATDLDAFAVEHGVSDRVRERVAGVTTDVMRQLTGASARVEPIVVEADIDGGNVQIVFTRELASRAAVAELRSSLAATASSCDGFSTQHARDGSAVEVWVCFTLPSCVDAHR